MRWQLRVCLGLSCVALTAAPIAPAQSEPATFGFTLSPTAGPPGTRVRFEGDVPTDSSDFSSYQDPQFAYGLNAIDVPTSPPDCSLVVEMEHVTKTVTDQGHITGSFVVGGQGSCNMSAPDLGPQPARPGVYEVLLGCHACTPAGTFTITSPRLARTGSDAEPLAAAGTGLLGAGLALTVIAHVRRKSCCA